MSDKTIQPQAEAAAQFSETVLGIVGIFAPQFAPALATAKVAVHAVGPLVVKAYDALMNARPAEVSEAEWRGLLGAAALNKTAADYVREALEKRLPPPPPQPPQS